jgi:hypothetical protein
MIRRSLVAVILAVGGLVPFFAAPAANAIPICQGGFTCLYVYYSTAARTTPIGYFSISCNEQGVSSGTTSAYFNFTEARCNS